MSNQLDNLLKSRFHVDSVKFTGDDAIQYWCRDLPHSTVLEVLANVFDAISDDKAIKQFEVFVSAADKSDKELEALIGSALPVLRHLCTRGGKLVNRILMDVVVDMTEKHVNYVPVEDALAIVERSIERVDTNTLAGILRKAFSRVVQIGGKVPPKKDQDIPPIKDSEQLSFDTQSTPQQ